MNAAGAGDPVLWGVTAVKGKTLNAVLSERLSLAVAAEFPRATFSAGNVGFRRDTWFNRLLHNQTAYAIQCRLQWAGLSTVILPARIG